jgi:LysM repeat protein
VTRRSWRTLAAPAAFLLAATIAILVARAVLDHGRSAPAPAPRAAAAPTTTRTKPAPKPHHRLYTVRAGDTLAAIAARSGVPLALIETLNPTLRPTALFIGEKIRLK